MSPPTGTPAVIALGSNLGYRQQNLRSGVKDIGLIDGVTVTAVSDIVESQAVKPTGTDASAPQYLNAVILVTCDLDPETLLTELNRIETDHGRVRVERWGDRTLDLDLIAFGTLTHSSVRLTLPHPRAWERSFVIVPWRQIDPEARLAGRGRIDQLAAARTDALWEYNAATLFADPCEQKIGRSR